MKPRGLLAIFLLGLGAALFSGCAGLGNDNGQPTAGDIVTVAGPKGFDESRIWGLAASDDGETYVAVGRQPGLVKKIDPADGNAETVVGGGTSSSFSGGVAGKDVALSEATGLGIGLDQSLLITDRQMGRILRWDPDSDAVTVLAEDIPGPTDVAVLNDGRIAVCTGRALLLMKPSSGDLNVLASVPCWDVAVTSEGKLWSVGANNYGGNDSRVMETDPDTGITRTVAGQRERDLFASDRLVPIGNCGPVGDARMIGPQSVASAPSGDMYIYDSSEAAMYVRRVDGQTGIIEGVVGPPGDGYRGFDGDGGPALKARLNKRDAARIAVDGSGNLYITGRDRIRKVLAPIPGSCD